MIPVRWSRKAEEDLTEIWTHFAQRSFDRADEVVEEILSAADLIGQFPHAYRERPKIRPGLRVCPVGRYLIYYSLDDEGAFIERLRPGAEDHRRIIDL